MSYGTLLCRTDLLCGSSNLGDLAKLTDVDHENPKMQRFRIPYKSDNLGLVSFPGD